ncbi:MAG: hypothetical protein DWQ04_00105 [Chloroflexi bacterium]|nr:MAG: hypothetical protein DWQ04_00105 [Chloroflexota bacterium]
MAKKSSRRKSSRQSQRKTNWTVIYGVIAAGVILLGGLLYLSLQTGEIVTIPIRCEDDAALCVTKGEANAPVTIVEILDFGCNHCQAFHQETAPLIDAQYVENGDVKFVMYPYALSGNTLPGTNAALCAEEQDAYFAFTDALFDQFGQPDYLTSESIIRAGETAGVEMTSFTQCVSEGRYNDVIQENMSVARNNRINSTPNFFVNGEKLEGNQPFSIFQQRIESYLN